MRRTFNLPLETERLCIRPFTPDDIEDFGILVNVPDNAGWKTQKENLQGFLTWHLSKYDTMDVIHDIVCLGVFKKTVRNNSWTCRNRGTR